MIYEDLKASVRYQTCLFTALTGVLVGRQLTSKIEVAAALKVIESSEQNQTVKVLLSVLSESLLDDARAPCSPARGPNFEIISGGKELQSEGRAEPGQRSRGHHLRPANG